MSIERGRDLGEDRGAVIAEFALVVPLLIVLLVGIIEFGRAYNIQVTLQGAAREGARAAALGESPAGAVDAASAGVAAQWTLIEACPADGSPAGNATIRVSSLYSFSIPLVPIDDKNLTATASMRCGL